jgi:putative transposase
LGKCPTGGFCELLCSIICSIRNGLRWRDAPPSCRPHKTIFNRFIRWSELGVFGRVFVSLAKEKGEAGESMIDAVHLKAHGTAAGLLKKMVLPRHGSAPKAA